MRILILSASIGSGHLKAAEAIKKSLSGEVFSVDFMSKEVSGLNAVTKKIYLAALKFIPDLYDRIYRFAGKKQVGILIRLITSLGTYFPFVRLLKKFRPDIIICTHPFPEAAAALWKFLHPKASRKFLLAAVLTDYSLHEIWIYGEVDMYFVATEEMKNELAGQSRPGVEIFAPGIPTGKEFSEIERKKISGRTTILIMGGGLGLGSIESTLTDLENISSPLKIIVVAGRNEKLLSRLKSLQTKLKHEIEIFGYVENICELMSESDLLITKPGALTMSEAFSAGLPMILHAPIPGPEAKNAEYAIKNGAAVSGGEEKISGIVEKFLQNLSGLDEMKIAAKKIGRPDAAADIAKIISAYKPE